LATYPDDANGDVFRRMEAHGDDLTKPRDIDFAVVFPDERSAKNFAERIHSLGYKATVKNTEREDFPWDVIVVNHMASTYDGINNFEDLLKSIADDWGGQNDGWGCFNVQPQPN
jgi:hypothetical protein